MVQRDPAWPQASQSNGYEVNAGPAYTHFPLPLAPLRAPRPTCREGPAWLQRLRSKISWIQSSERDSRRHVRENSASVRTRPKDIKAGPCDFHGPTSSTAAGLTPHGISDNKWARGHA